MLGALLPISVCDISDLSTPVCPCFLAISRARCKSDRTTRVRPVFLAISRARCKSSTRGYRNLSNGNGNNETQRALIFCIHLVGVVSTALNITIDAVYTIVFTIVFKLDPYSVCILCYLDRSCTVRDIQNLSRGIHIFVH